MIEKQKKMVDSVFIVHILRRKSLNMNIENCARTRFCRWWKCQNDRTEWNMGGIEVEDNDREWLRQHLIPIVCYAHSAQRNAHNRKQSFFQWSFCLTHECLINLEFVLRTNWMILLWYGHGLYYSLYLLFLFFNLHSFYFRNEGQHNESS